MNVKEKSEKVGLKLNIQITKIVASNPITPWQIDREGNSGNSERLYFIFFGGGAPKSLQIVTPGIKLKDACSLEEKL